MIRHSKAASSRFVFDAFDGGLVFIPVVEAQRLSSLNDALESSSTWGEFLSRIANDKDVNAYLEDQYGGELPNLDDIFDPGEIPGFADEDWPSWPKQAMLSWLPASVQTLGTIADSVLSGSFLRLEEAVASDVVAALRSVGIACEPDTRDLISRACGAWRYT